MPQPFIQSYKYDSLNRLKEASETQNGSQTWSQQFGYDQYGNRISTSQNINGTSINATPAVDPNSNRFQPDQGFSYDKNGNVVQDIDAVTNQSRSFILHGDNKQTQVKDANGSTRVPPLGQPHVVD